MDSKFIGIDNKLQLPGQNFSEFSLLLYEFNFFEQPRSQNLILQHHKAVVSSLTTKGSRPFLVREPRN
jgi:hypothetical protein